MIFISFGLCATFTCGKFSETLVVTDGSHFFCHKRIEQTACSVVCVRGVNQQIVSEGSDCGPSLAGLIQKTDFLIWQEATEWFRPNPPAL